MIRYTTCPVCDSDKIAALVTCTDHTVSRQRFSVWECSDCTLRFTQDIPSQQEIGPFYKADAYVSHTDTREGLVNRLYHAVRGITIKSKRKLVERQTGISNGNILDIGCGTGAFLHEMENSCWTITGLEPDEQASQNASKLYGIQTQEPDSLFQLPAASFHAITMWHVLEHVHRLHDYVHTMHDLISKEGRIFIAVPNYTSHDAAYYREHWAAYDVPRHLYHFSPKSMEVLLHKHGLTLKAIKPMWFDSFYVSMLSEQIRNKKGNIVSAFITGLVSNVKALFNKKKCSSVIYVVEKKVQLV